jgi:peptidoglycan/xylan/chitin deacetylase (PgdA/CDA1 family)/ubiquinone/menaquinone biosynthesis C-methylase UbiE
MTSERGTGVGGLTRGRLKPRIYYVAAREYERHRARHALARAAAAGPRQWSGVRILGYHRIADDRDVLAVGPDRFRRQLETLLEAGVEPVSLRRALEVASEERQHFCVTFDDGYLDVLTNAVPILRELELPATIFVPSAVIDGDATYWWYHEPPAAMTWDEIRQLDVEELFDVEAHGRTHRPLPRLTEAEARDEIAGSKREIEARLGRPVTAFCYPAGLYGEREVQIVAEAGYELAVTTDPGVNSAEAEPHRLRRTMVAWGDDDASFGAKVAGLLDRRSRLASAVHARRARQAPPAPQPLAAVQRFFAANRAVSERLGERLPQAQLDIEALYDEIVLEKATAAPGLLVADVGAGRSSTFARRIDPALGTRVVGVDSSAEELALNEDVAERRVADVTTRLPFEDGEVDVLVSRSTVEHLADVEGFVRESSRVLKSGGFTVHLFASKYAPYALINQALPDEAATKIVTYLRPGTEGKLGFPAFYDRSYDSAFRGVLDDHGFEVEQVHHGWYQSEYFAFLAPLFALSALYELAIRKVEAKNLAARLLVVAQKR